MKMMRLSRVWPSTTRLKKSDEVETKRTIVAFLFGVGEWEVEINACT